MLDGLRGEDGTDTLDMVLAADRPMCATSPGCSANGPSYIAGERADYIEAAHRMPMSAAPRESPSSVAPADADFGRAETIIKQRERIKRHTIEHRRLQDPKLAA